MYVERSRRINIHAANEGMKELNIKNLEIAVAEMGKEVTTGDAMLVMGHCNLYAIVNKNYHYLLVILKDDKRNIEDMIQKIHTEYMSCQ